MKGFIVSLVWIIFVISLFFVSTIGNALAQSCGTVRIDRYSCSGTPNQFGLCPPKQFVSSDVVSCSFNGSQCRSQSYCSSNDTCNPVNSSGGTFCGCSQSSAACETIAPPAPPPVNQPPPASGGGGCDAGCGRDSDCGGGLSCQSRGGKNVCWGNACEPAPIRPTLCNGQPDPGNCCILNECNGSTACYQQESGWWCDEPHWQCNSPGRPNSWSACSPSCGNGQQTNGCGATRYCNNGPCCTNSAPSPYLSSPPDQQSLSGTSVTLSWGISSWGTNCSGNSNSFTAYVQECPGFIDPTTIFQSGLPASQTSIGYTGQGSKSYCWAISASNGVLSTKTYPRRWTILDQPWWQVSGGGVMAGGNITSRVNTGKLFIKDTPAVVAANGIINLNGQQASSTNWQANDPSAVSNVLNYRYDYETSYSRVYAHIKPTEYPTGLTLINASQITSPDISYVHVTGDLNVISDLNFGSNKVVILVEGNANLNHNINFDDNLGLFALYVKGNINIDPQVGTVTGTGVDPDTLIPNLEGIFLTNGSFNTGTGTRQLRIDGPVIGIGGVNFQRNLSSQWPNEYIVFRPDILMNLPKPLLRQNNLWREGNP